MNQIRIEFPYSFLEGAMQRDPEHLDRFMKERMFAIINMGTGALTQEQYDDIYEMNKSNLTHLEHMVKFMWSDGTLKKNKTFMDVALPDEEDMILVGPIVTSMQLLGMTKENVKLLYGDWIGNNLARINTILSPADEDTASLIVDMLNHIKLLEEYKRHIETECNVSYRND